MGHCCRRSTGQLTSPRRERHTLSRRRNNMDDLTDKFTETAMAAGDRLTDLGGRALDKVDENRKPLAKALDSTASSIRDTAAGAGSVADVANNAADRVESAADYLRENDSRTMIKHVGGLVKKHPAQSLAVAAAVGFLVGRAFSRG